MGEKDPRAWSMFNDIWPSEAGTILGIQVDRMLLSNYLYTLSQVPFHLMPLNVASYFFT